MNGLLKREYGLTLALALFSFVLGAVVLVEWDQLDRRQDKRRAEMARPVQPELALEELSQHDFELPAIDSYVELIERPLFIQGRKPLEEQPAETQQSLNKPQGSSVKAKLMGIYSGSEGMTALIVNAEGKYVRVRRKDDVDGWQLDGIFPDRVTLKQGGETQKLMLHKPKPKARKRTRPPESKKLVSKSKSKSKLNSKSRSKSVAKFKKKKEASGDQETSDKQQ